MVEPVQEPDDALVLVRVADVELVVVGGGAQREEELAGDARPHLFRTRAHAAAGQQGAGASGGEHAVEALRRHTASSRARSRCPSAAAARDRTAQLHTTSSTCTFMYASQ